ncbi:54S ribosomal protein L7, mitochondrial [Exophiala xenobiotica]|uniref:54S ribosomal protein L7, mitochondrial n=1 Tax=Lithohypha guttulata TaxID=1690604 RepID=A0ABR0KIM1_9EURO|nr:54S ribosomal protein L7, mitochondrial [Lithohypha guttulata]KAK5329474.1 54S ribosomal protein L7, mitochondrial [Exophiala xenobiotica]
MKSAMHIQRSLRQIRDTSICNTCRRELRRAASSQAAATEVSEDLESSSFAVPPPSEQDAARFDPLKPSRTRPYQLPSSRYQYRSPRFDRGPLAPHRPPPPTDPASRQFVPGPFSQSRLETTYHNTIAPDFMTMTYQHRPPGFRPIEKGPRLRSWEGDNPYFANRQLRGPRGGDVLRLLRKPITFRNVPMVERLTVHSYCKDVVYQGSGVLHVAGMALQEITGQRVQTHLSKHPESGWGLVKGKSIACTANLKGEDMYHFLDKLINVVMPRIKDWRGVRATTGDNSGNISFGFEPDVVSTFPEIENNYDAYPPKMIPGLHVTVHTTARADKDARLLLEALGVPFYGKIVD